MEKAVNAVNSRSLSIRAAALEYGIPRTTLRDKASRGEVVKKHRGGKRAITEDEEKALIDWVAEAEECGDPLPLQEINKGAANIIKHNPRQNKFKDNIPGDWWRRNLLKRNKDQIRVRKPEALPPASSCISIENLCGWWVDTNAIFMKNNYLEIMKDPTRIANCDESPLMFNPKAKQYVFQTGTKTSYVAETAGSKVSVTVMMTVKLHLFIII